MKKRLIIFIISVFVAIAAAWFWRQVNPSLISVYLTCAVLAIIFLGIMISNQQYEEDFFSKVERSISAFLFSYIMFFQFLYVPLRQFFFGTLITNESFPADLLALLLFAIFFFLFGTTFLVLNTYSRVGFLTRWRIFNNNAMFYVLRSLFIPAVSIFAMLIIRMYF